MSSAMRTSVRHRDRALGSGVDAEQLFEVDPST